MRKSIPIAPRLVASLGALALVTSVGACAGPTIVSGDEERGAVGVDYAGVEPAKEISFWSNHPGASLEYEKEIAAAFKAETGITVNLVTAGASYPEVSQKFQTAQISGDVGDLVVLSDAYWFQAYLARTIIPVDDVFAEVGLDTSGYWPAFYEDYLYDGSHYAAPYARSTPIFCYNKDHYRAAGLDPDHGPETWEQAREYSLKLKEANLGAIPYAYPPEQNYPAWTMSNLLWAYGGAWSDGWDFSTLTDSHTLEAMNFAQDSVKEGWAAVLSGEPSTDFAAGAASQSILSTGNLTALLNTADFELGVSFLPAGPADTDKIVPTGGAGVAIAAKSTPERQVAAAMFLKFLTNDANTASFSAKTGYIPVRQAADMSAVYAEKPIFETAVNQMRLTRSQDFARVFVPGGDVAINQGIVSILAGGSAVEPTMAEIQSQLQDLFDRDLKRDVE